MPNDWKQHTLKPVVGNVPASAPRPRAGNVPERKKWRFSLRYWRQVAFFGVDQCSKSWFVSLLERPSELSGIDLEDLMRGEGAAAIRFHPIDWEAKNIPIKRADIDWLGDHSGQEFELMQFHISKSKGRVVGFFDQESVFYIVLLDPLHNLQPAGDYKYRVRASHIADCEITRISYNFERAIMTCDFLQDAQKMQLLDDWKKHNLDYFGTAVHLSISDVHLSKAYRYVDAGLIKNLGEFFRVRD